MVAAARTKNAGLPKLPDSKAKSIEIWGLRVQGTPDSIVAPMLRTRMPSASVTAPDVSPPGDDESFGPDSCEPGGDHR